MLQSSGTTGRPLDLFHDRRTVLLNVAYGERERAIETAFVGKRARYTRLQLGSDLRENIDRVRGFMAETSFRPLRPRYVRGSLSQAPTAVDELIDTVRPDIILGAGSHLEAFFRAAAARGGPKHRAKALLYTWDHMSPGGRKLIEDTFGMPVISKYSAMECLKVGFTCEEREGFHLHEDLCQLTIVDRNGKRLPDGEPGEIVLSNLVNRGSVLLNYRIGDLGRISTAACACGRTTQVLADLEGRTSEYVATARRLLRRPVHPHHGAQPRSRRRALPARPGLADVVRAAARPRSTGRRSTTALPPPRAPSGRSSAATTSRPCTSRRCPSSRGRSTGRSCCSPDE